MPFESYVFICTVVYRQGKGILACPGDCHIHANGFKGSNFRKMSTLWPRSQNKVRAHLPGERDYVLSPGRAFYREGIKLRTRRG